MNKKKKQFVKIEIINVERAIYYLMLLDIQKEQ